MNKCVSIDRRIGANTVKEMPCFIDIFGNIVKECIPEPIFLVWVTS